MVVCLLHEMMVSVFEHLGITNWRGIYQRWVFVENVLKETYLTKSRNAVLDSNELAMHEAGNQ